MLVRELMTLDPATVTPDTSVAEALRLLAKHRITCLPVLDQERFVEGVVSESDLLRDLVPRDRRAHERPPVDGPLARPSTVGQVMTAHVVAVHPEHDVASAVQEMAAAGVKSVPVTDGRGRLLGVLSRSDVIRVMAQADDDLVRAVAARLDAVGLRGWSAAARDGVVTLTGPEDGTDDALAQLVAATAPGVVEVTCD